MAIKKLYSSDSRRKTISKLNNNFVSIAPDIILEVSDDKPTENVANTIWIDTSVDIITKEINTQTYADEYFASHLTIDKNTFKYIGDDGKPTLEFKKMLYGDDYDPSFRYILKPKNRVFKNFCKPIKLQNGITGYTLNSVEFDIKNVNELDQTFNGAAYLKSIDISSWDTSNITYMSYTFNGCRSLTSLDVSKWTISALRNMTYIFAYCSSLTSLDVSKWNVSLVTNMEGVFYNCSSLTSLDLSNWDTSKATAMGYMFADCNSLTTITGVLDFKKCTGYNSIFANCNNLTSVKVKNLPTDIDTFCTRAKIDKSKVIVVE